MDLEQAFNMFIMSREEYCTEMTVYNYKHTLKYFLDFIVQHKGLPINQIDIESLDKSDLQAYTLYLRDKPKYENHPFNIVQKKYNII